MRFCVPKVKIRLRSLLTWNACSPILLREEDPPDRMRDAYLILCHNRPAQINALAAHFGAGGHDVYIHVDAKSTIAHLIRTNASIRLITPPSDVVWGGWTQVEAMLKLLSAAMNSGRTYRYLHLLSGQCMPLLSPATLDARLDEAAASNTQFIECEPLPRRIWDDFDGGLHRAEIYFPAFFVSKYTNLHRDFFWPYIRMWKRLGLRRPLYRQYAPFFGGAQWFSLTQDCVRALFAAMRREPGLVRFFRHTFCSDELFFPTLLARTDYRARAAGNGRYLRWPGGDVKYSPDTLRPEDWPAALASGYLFGRKFELEAQECTRFLSQLP